MFEDLNLKTQQFETQFKTQFETQFKTRFEIRFETQTKILINEI